MTAEPEAFQPGDSVTLTLAIQAPSIRAGGVFITSAGIGALQTLSGEGLALATQGLTHMMPKSAANGAVTFRFGWKAPPQPGAVDFRVAALAANGNGAPSGDWPGSGEFQWVFGCTGRAFFADSDRDGYGSQNLGTRLGCSDQPAPEGFAALEGDCDENDEKVHLGAVEVCNKKDDDCNGQIDENAPPVMMWPDQDGDGYYRTQTGTAKLGCGNTPGYAALAGDCDDYDPAVNPGATETCNNRDDNCDGQADERARPTCGKGLCARYSASCDPADCAPGPPATEECNSFDDDCDGQSDNDACPVGMVCTGHECVGSAGGTGSAGSSAGTTSAGAAASGATGSGGSGQNPAARTGGCTLMSVPGRATGWGSLLLLAVAAGLDRLRRSRLLRRAR
jgi:hypothetical protein